MTERHTLHTTILGDGDALRLVRRKLRAQVKKGPDKKRKVELESDRIVIGTHPSCDLVLSDPTVSRQHCEVVLVDKGYALRDLDSTNGTFVSGLRLGEVVFTDDVTVDLGSSTVVLQLSSDTVSVELGTATRFGPLVGRSPAMRQVFQRLARVAPGDTTVLITGESGTGKELAARAIHENSARAKGPFVVVDCGALPTNLIESELYGHVRGAFTGATRDHPGAFRAASGGTLFLDEIGELPVDLQTRLLGALERREVQPVGMASSVAVDVRVVAATNRDLRREVNVGGFREDLYFRLAVVTVQMPSLRERPEDLPLYVHGFLEELGAQERGFTLDAVTMQRLQAQPWKGNVRELRNVIERAVALGEVDVDEAVVPAAQPTLPAVTGDIDVDVPFKLGKQVLIENYERQYVAALMAKYDNNITQAARGAEIDRVYLLRVLDKYGMRPKR